MLLKNKKEKVKTKKDIVAGGKCEVLSDEVKFAKEEVSYFKGLSIFLTALMVIIFFSFGSLFGLMYLETRYISLQVDEAILSLKNVDSGSCSCDLCGGAADESSAVAEDQQVLPTIDLTKWISFEKYGFEAWFPNTWSFLDRPYQKQAHLFLDGKVRDSLGSEWGDVTVSFVENDVYKDKYDKSVVNIAGTYGFKYAVKKGTNESEVIIVPTSGGYIELHIYKIQDGKTLIAQEIVDALIAQFKLK